MAEAPKPPPLPRPGTHGEIRRQTPPSGYPTVPRQDDEDITGRVDLDEFEKQRLRNERLREHESRLREHSKQIHEQALELSDVRGDYRVLTEKLDSVATRLQELVDLETDRQKRDADDRAAAKRSSFDGRARVFYAACAVLAGGAAHWLMGHITW